MAISELVRSSAYWAVDALKGGRVRQHLKDIDRLINNREMTDRVSSERLQGLLKHACKYTPYYKQFQGCNQLSDFPVIKKETIKRNVDSFISTAYKKKELTVMTTSGSYGVPMKFYLSPDKRARQLAEIIYFGRWVGYDVGVNHAYIRSQPSVVGKSPLVLFMQNEIMMDSTVLSKDWLERQRQRLRNKDVHFLIGYASAIIELAEYINSCEDTPDEYAVKGVTVLAEPFSDIMREKIVKAFGCPVVAKYSSQETGVIACECPEHYEYHINSTSFIIELLEINTDNPVENGQLGRVIVTDLFSHAMPLIRYDIGDLAVMSHNCRCGLDTLVFERVEGRIAAVVNNTSGDMVHFASIVNRIWDMNNVLMYQFIQEDEKEYTVKLVPLPDYDQEDEIIYRKRIKEVLGEDAQIRFEKVEDIPPLNSGKRPFYINNYRQKQ